MSGIRRAAVALVGMGLGVGCGSLGSVGAKPVRAHGPPTSPWPSARTAR